MVGRVKLLIGDGQVAGCHLDDDRQRGTVAFLSVFVPVLRPTRTVINVDQCTFNSHFCVDLLRNDQLHIARAGFDSYSGIILQFTTEIKFITARAAGKYQRGEVCVGESAQSHV